MITGFVSAFKQAFIPITLIGLNERPITVEAQVDTGFDGFLTLPEATVQSLGCPFREIRSFELGDGSLVEFAVHEAHVDWLHGRKRIEVLVSEGGILVGISLMNGSKLMIDNIDGGLVQLVER